MSNVENTAVTETNVNTNDQSDREILESFTKKPSETFVFSDEQKSIYIAMDLGTTGTRDLVINKGQPFSPKSIITTTSDYAAVGMEEDFTSYGRTSEKIEDNAEFIIKEIPSPLSSVSWFNEPMRVVKQNLISFLKKSPQAMDNLHDKSSDVCYYINMLTAIAVRAFLARETNVKVHPGMILPPKERYADPERFKEILNTIAGVYEVKMPRYDFVCKITIEKNDIIMYAEGEVAYIHYVSSGPDAKKKKDDLEGKRIVLIDWGGSTLNIGLMENGILVNAVSHTSKLGAEILFSRLNLIMQRTSKEPISESKIREGVRKGYMTFNDTVVPVGAQLTTIKNDLTPKLYNEVSTFLRNAALLGSDVDAYMYLGRGMLGTGKPAVYGEGNEITTQATLDYSPSMAELVSYECAKISPRSEHIIVPHPGIANLLGIAGVLRSTCNLF